MVTISKARIKIHQGGVIKVPVDIRSVVGLQPKDEIVIVGVDKFIIITKSEYEEELNKLIKKIKI